MFVFPNVTTEQDGTSVRLFSLREAATEYHERFPQRKSDFPTRYSGFSLCSLWDTELCIFFPAALHLSEDVCLLLRLFMSGSNTCGVGSPYSYYMFLHYSIKLVWMVFYSSPAIQQVSRPSLCHVLKTWGLCNVTNPIVLSHNIFIATSKKLFYLCGSW